MSKRTFRLTIQPAPDARFERYDFTTFPQARKAFGAAVAAAKGRNDFYGHLITLGIVNPNDPCVAPLVAHKSRFQMNIECNPEFFV